MNVRFFIRFLSDSFGQPIELGTHETSDILVESVWARAHVPSLLDTKRWSFTFFYTGESFFSFPGYPTVPFKAYTAILGFKDSRSNFVGLPLFVLYKTLHPDMMSPVTVVPKYSVGVVIGNPNGRVRNKFLDSLEKNMVVSYGGSFRNNIGTKIGGSHVGSELIQFYRNSRNLRCC